MDPFEVRMQFLNLLRRLDASRESIQKVVSYALKYFSRCGEDLWDCIIEECQKGTINSRMNVFYFLDSLCETSLLSKTHANARGGAGEPSSSYYVDFVQRDLEKIVSCVVPEGREGLPNMMSTTQILESWRSKRVVDPQTVDGALASLQSRKSFIDAAMSDAPLIEPPSLSRPDIFRRIEEDRVRHKRLRERRWVQPIVYNPNPHLLPQLASFMPATDDADGEGELTLDIEFENEWETTSDWNEDDEDAIAEENELCFPNSTRDKMDAT